jgi:hypothetical protein
MRYAWGWLILRMGLLPRVKPEGRLSNWTELERLDLLKNRFESTFQLLLRSWFSFGLSKLLIVCD